MANDQAPADQSRTTPEPTQIDSAGVSTSARQWQPIGTAPRDGTIIRLGHERDPSSMKIDGYFQTEGSFDGEEWEVSAFFIIPGGKRGMMTGEPTHWLPTKPTGGIA